VTHRLGHFNAESLTGGCWGKCSGFRGKSDRSLQKIA